MSPSEQTHTAAVSSDPAPPHASHATVAHSETSLRRNRHRLRWVAAIAVAALVLWGAVVGSGPHSRTGPTTSVAGELETAIVKRAPLRVSVDAEGVLESVHSDVVISQVEWKTKIIMLVPEGTAVERGDIVCELDTSDLVARLDARRANGGR